MRRPNLYLFTWLGLGGLALELALTRHWQKWSQGLVWAFLLALAWALWLLRRRNGRRDPMGHRRVAALGLAGLAALGGLAGIAFHVWGNLDAGPLDRVHGKGWEALAWPARFWLAVTMRVGPAPALASGALLLFAGLVWYLADDAEGAP